jgi:hypothetical protein
MLDMCFKRYKRIMVDNNVTAGRHGIALPVSYIDVTLLTKFSRYLNLAISVNAAYSEYSILQVSKIVC